MGRVKFGDVVREVKSNVDRRNNPYEYYIAGGHMDSEEIIIHRRGRFADDDVGPAFIREFHAGQVLYGSRRTYLKKVAFADFDGVTANTTFVLETKDENILCQRLLPFLMLSDGFTRWSVMMSKGSTNPYVLFSDIAGYEFDLPAMDEQRKLARVLWAVNDTIEAYKRLMSATEELVRGQFAEMFGGIEKIQLAEIATIIMGQSPSSDSYNTNGDGVPFHQGSGEFTDKYVADGMFCTAPSRMANAGDVLVSVRAPVGTVNLTSKDCCIGRGLAAVRSKISSDCNEYLLYAFRAMKHTFESMGHGSTVKSINKNELHNLMIPNADLTEQNKFVALSHQSDKSKSSLQKALTAARNISRKIISENLN